MTRKEYLSNLLEGALSTPTRVVCASARAARNLRWSLYEARKNHPQGQELMISLKGANLEIIPRGAKGPSIISVEPMELEA